MTTTGCPTLTGRNEGNRRKIQLGTLARKRAIAKDWRRQINAGEVANQAAIAKQEGVSSAYVCKVLGLLK